MNNKTYIGIDFGTTNTAVYLVHYDNGYRVTPLGEDGEYPFSSIIAVPRTGGNLKFGREVRERRMTLNETHDIYTSMKSYLGTDKKFDVNGKIITAKELTASFLKYVQEYIRDTYKYDITEAYFAFPEDFSPQARVELAEAACIAGFNANGYIGEATAAYVASYKEVNAFSKTMVVDWGGGTLDICIINVEGTKVSEEAIYGIKFGGDDIDLELARRVHAKLVHDAKDEFTQRFEEMSSSEKDQLIMKCEEAKIEFSHSEDDYTITLRNYGPYKTKNITITYDFFENVITPLIMNKVLNALETALERANTNRDGIDAVILTGGSSNLTPYKDMMYEIFGHEKMIILDDLQWVVAKGAALIGITGGSYKINDDICVLLSDNSVFPIFQKNVHGVGDRSDKVLFSLTEDAPVANFIFVNSDKSRIYDRMNVSTKGFLYEDLELNAKIQLDHVVRITVSNKVIGNKYSKEVEINQVTFHYDLGAIENIFHN